MHLQVGMGCSVVLKCNNVLVTPLQLLKDPHIVLYIYSESENFIGLFSSLMLLIYFQKLLKDYF